FLAPGETKTFSQFWYPIAEIGTVQQATTDLALHHEVRTTDDGSAEVEIGLASTGAHPGATVRLEDAHGRETWSEGVDLDPRHPVRRTVVLPSAADGAAVVVVARDGAELLRRSPDAKVEGTVETAVEPPAPEAVGSVEELYLVGLHLSQYRHATRSPLPYWREALERDPDDSRSATALAAAAYGRGELDQAERLLRRAVARTTTWNANPYDGEPHYRLGLVLERLGRHDEAYDAWAKAAWTRAWRAPAHLAMAYRQCARGAWAEALVLLDSVGRDDSDNLAARDLTVLCLRRLGREDEADERLAATLALDPLDWWARLLSGDVLTCDARTARDLALQLARAGCLDDALDVLDTVLGDDRRRGGGQEPLLHYHRADLLERLGRRAEAALARDRARAVDTTWCFPHGLDDEAVLRHALDADGDDGTAAGLLGHLLYGADRPDEAIAAWGRAVA
ncbi:MAG: tetratricopeptide repeat protein, partial [Propionibacteriaceae bacterium]